MAEHEKELHFAVLYRGKTLELKASAGSTLGALGKEIVDLTGVAPHTLRLILPKWPPLQPLSEQHSTKLLYQSGITEGMKMRMMGSSSVEVAAVSQPSTNDRILGFSEEEQRARQRSNYAPGSYSLPKGNYIFCDFQTLRLPGIELDPPSSMALKIMHRLAADRGITAIMNKYRWRVGIMTEMAPIGYVGISPKCVLGFNKNRGQEISLRLRTDDLKGFRKYESIKKTLLHELAHMVHDEHDERFHALDKKLNDEAIALDWTKSQGHSLSGVKFEDAEEEMELGSSGAARGYKLGGKADLHMDARTAAAAAALRRFGDAGKRAPSDGKGESSKRTASTSSMPTPMHGVQSEPDPDEQEPRPVVVIAAGAIEKEEAAAEDITVCVPVRSQEPDPDEGSSEPVRHKEPDPDESYEHVGLKEPDPDEAANEHSAGKESYADAAVDCVQEVSGRVHDPESRGQSFKNKPYSDDAMSILVDAPLRSQEPDPDEASGGPTKNEPDPDEGMATPTDAPRRIQEPDPDEDVESGLDTSMRSQEPDPDEALSGPTNNEPDPDEGMSTSTDAPERTQEPDTDEVVENGLDSAIRYQEPDPDEASPEYSGNSNPGPDEARGVSKDHSVKTHEPDPDEVCNGGCCRDEPDPDEALDISSEDPVRKQEPGLDGARRGHSSRNEPDPDEAVQSVLDAPVRNLEPDPDEGPCDHPEKNVPDVIEAVDIVLDAPLRQEPDPDEVGEAVRPFQVQDPGTIHGHKKSIGDRDLDECAGCSRLAGKRMKSSSGGGFTELVKQQTTR